MAVAPPEDTSSTTTKLLADNDHDGIVNALDTTPNGTPAPDNDNDGIPNSIDATPNGVPTSVGPHGALGAAAFTTVRDNDNDGIPNSIDATPNGVPTSVGPHGALGAAAFTTVRDNDNDGIPNSIDATPNGDNASVGPHGAPGAAALSLKQKEAKDAAAGIDNNSSDGEIKTVLANLKAVGLEDSQAYKDASAHIGTGDLPDDPPLAPKTPTQKKGGTAPSTEPLAAGGGVLPGSGGSGAGSGSGSGNTAETTKLTPEEVMNKATAVATSIVSDSTVTQNSATLNSLAGQTKEQIVAGAVNKVDYNQDGVTDYTTAFTRNDWYKQAVVETRNLAAEHKPPTQAAIDAITAEAKHNPEAAAFLQSLKNPDGTIIGGITPPNTPGAAGTTTSSTANSALAAQASAAIEQAKNPDMAYYQNAYKANAQMGGSSIGTNDAVVVTAVITPDQFDASKGDAASQGMVWDGLSQKYIKIG